MTLLTKPFPENPGYGSGAFRRRIRLQCRADHAVFATLDDNYHAMQCLLHHDGRRVTAIDATFSRIPTTTCSGAANPIRELIGMPLDIAMTELYGDNRPRRNCTHLFDLAALALRQASRNESERCYDVFIPDQTDTPVTVEVRCNNQLVHAWQVFDAAIVAPLTLAQNPLLAGFTAWALRTLTDDDLEAAQVLHKGYYLAQTRRYRPEAFAGRSLLANPVLQGVCHSYAPGQIENSHFTGDNVRDFSTTVIEAVTLPT